MAASQTYPTPNATKTQAPQRSALNQSAPSSGAHTIAPMNQIPFLLTKQELDRYGAALFAWLVWAVFLVMRLGVNAHRSKRLKRVIARCERFVHAYLICTALSRLHRPKHAPPTNAAPGLRIGKAHPRLLARSMRSRSKSFYKRILHALHMFANPERFLARLTRKLRSSRRFLNLILATPIADAIPSAAPRAIARADSS